MTPMTIAAFLIALGVLFVIMAASQGQPRDRAARRRVAIPPRRVQILALVFFIAGFATMAYGYYTGQVGFR